MAKQVSNIKVQGTVDGITYYERNGVFYARKKTKTSRETRDSNPNLEDFRNNQKEFGGSMRPVKAFNKAFKDVKSLFFDKSVSRRLGKLFKMMINRAAGELGKRPIEMVANRDLLEGLEFNEALWFGEVTKIQSAVAINAGRTEVTLTVQPFVPQFAMKPPSRATHFEIINFVAILSNYAYEEEAKGYEPIDKFNNGKKFSASSGILPINEVSTALINVVNPLTGLTNLNASSGVLSCVGIRFYEERLDVMYPRPVGAAMRLQSVF